MNVSEPHEQHALNGRAFDHRAVIRRHVHDATYGRLFAAGYDLLLRRTEDGGLGDTRRALLARAQGVTLEIGAGTGINLEHYPDTVTSLILTEPDQHMTRKLEHRSSAVTLVDKVIRAAGDSLPFADDTFDTAVITLVLCTATDPSVVLDEIARVLKPGGRLLFIEHVRDDSPRLAARQDRRHKPWRALGNGCNCNRPTLATLNASPLEVEHLEHSEMPKTLSFLRPLISGYARKPDSPPA